MQTPYKAKPVVVDDTVSVSNDELVVRNKRISLYEVTGIKYGHARILLDMYSVGGRYILEFKTPEEKIQLNFRSYFGIGRKKQYQKFASLMDAVWQQTAVRLLDEMTASIEAGETVEIGRCRVNSSGIIYKNFLIEWDDLSYQKNYNRITINSRSNPKVWTNLYFLETYNVDVLMHYLEARFENVAESATA